MKIGIISDTHITKERDLLSLAALLDNGFKEADIIIHAGDYVNIEVLKLLERYKRFVGVWGNVDDSQIKSILNEQEILTLAGYKIGIFHGHGTKGNTLDRAYQKFLETDVDIIIFGHSHQPLVRTKNGILMLNPGSLTNKRREKWFTYIMLELYSGSIDVQLKMM